MQAAGSLWGSGEKYIVDVGGREKDVEEENKCDPTLNVRSGLTRTCNDVEMVLESMSGVRAHGYGDKGDLRQNEELGVMNVVLDSIYFTHVGPKGLGENNLA